jgi:hypothetical protein
MRRFRFLVTAAAASAVTALAALPSAASGQAIGPVQGSQAMVGTSGIAVPPVQRSEVANMIDAGTIDAEGYTHLTVNLAAEMKSPAVHQGVIGAVLIPDVHPFDLAYTSLGLLPASLDLTSPVAANGGLYTMAKQATLDVGFSRYRVLLYNTTGSAATVAFFAYRSRR